MGHELLALTCWVCKPEQGLGRWVGSRVRFVSGFQPLFIHRLGAASVP